MPEPSIKEPQPSPLQRAIVARGRTVCVPEVSKRRVVSYTGEGAAVYQAQLREYAPGHEVRLPAEEIAQLRKSGHLVDPDAIAPEQAIGADSPRYIEGAPR